VGNYIVFSKLWGDACFVVMGAMVAHHQVGQTNGALKIARNTNNGN